MIPVSDVFKNAYDERRLGVLLISDELLKENPDIVQAVQAKCLLFGAEHDYVQRYFVVRACSAEFDAVQLGMMVPIYAVEVTRHSDDTGAAIGYDISFVKEHGKAW